MKDHRKFIENAESRIAEIGVLSEETVDFYKSLYDYQKRQYTMYFEMPARSDHIQFDKLPLLSSDAGFLSKEMHYCLKNDIAVFLEILKRFTNNDEMHYDILEEAVSEGDLDIRKFIESLLEMDTEALTSRAFEYKIDTDEFIFILVNWFKPLFVAMSEKLADKIDQNQWHNSSCPVCGYLPDMAKIDQSQEGKRYLHCALCENTWTYKRISCTVCGNEDMSTLGYYAEDNSPYRIDYCDKCKNYIKSVGIPKFTESDSYDLTVENIITANLDAWAIQKGYTRP